jgi:molecular chaperone DnaK (HSP70)
METIYGIDLGTSNCMAAVVKHTDGKFEVECMKSGELEINGETLTKTPQEIYDILRHFQSFYGKRIQRAVVTVPAYFSDHQKQAVLTAGELAGIRIEELIEEPAAAIMYHLYSLCSNQHVSDALPQGRANFLVFDFGGGTLDLSLIQVTVDEDGMVRPIVLLHEGDADLGGNDIDIELCKYLLEELCDLERDQKWDDVLNEYLYYYQYRTFRKECDPRTKSLIIKLKEMSEVLKIRLSSEDVVKIRLNHDKSLELSREAFENDIMDCYFKDRILDCLLRLHSKNTARHPIDHVILVGGSSQIPYVRKMLHTQFPGLQDRITTSEDYDRAIAMGAAIVGAIRNGLSVPPFGMNRCYSTVSHNILVEHQGEQKVLIEYGTPYPLPEPRKITFQVKHSLQPGIHFKIIKQHERYNNLLKKRVSEQIVINEFTFYHPFFYTGESITLSLTIDEYGLLRFQVIHDLSGESIEFESKYK